MDLTPRVSTLSGTELGSGLLGSSDRVVFDGDTLPLLDLNDLYTRLLQHKSARSYDNFFIPRTALPGILHKCEVRVSSQDAKNPLVIKGGAHRIVIEAKDDKNYTIENALSECAVARDNRSAQAAIFLFGKGKAPLGMQAIHRVGTDILLTWDEEDPATDLNLQVAFAVAKVIALGSNAVSGKAAERYDALVRAADSLMKQADKMKELSDMGLAIQRNGGELIQKASTAESEIRRQTREVADATGWLKDNDGKESERMPADPQRDSAFPLATSPAPAPRATVGL